MTLLKLRNGQAAPVDRVPVLSMTELRKTVIEETGCGKRLSAFFGWRHEGAVRVLAALSDDGKGELNLLAADPGSGYPALTPSCPQAHLFERELFEQWGVRPEGHPWLKPVRFPTSTDATCGVTDYFQVQGEEVHEVAVGPVHAGIIEPGHFRFQCHGESVRHLEISLGYQHRGVEAALVHGPSHRSIHYAETLAGDTSVGHAWAYCQAVEALCGVSAPPRAEALRSVGLELERIANHIGDLSALAGDVGFLPTQSFCGRIRGDALNLTGALCGSRFGRGLVRPGGAGFDLDAGLAAEMLSGLKALGSDATSAVDLMWETTSVTGRFEAAGVVSPEDCRTLGLVGPAARAAGINLDVRRDHAFGAYRYAMLPVSSWHGGDVFGRAQVRWMETLRSLEFVREFLESMPAGPVKRPLPDLRPGHVTASLIEGWRGEICHVAVTGEDGRFAAYKVVDPSFHNWFGLALCLRGQAISDFPLCNKSFNLSYCGHDL